MRTLILVSALALAACSPTTYNVNGVMRDGAKYGDPVKTIVVRGRTWTVAQGKQQANSFRATRDNNNLNPFVLPAAPLPPQAVTAIEQATGCKVILSSMWENPSAQFFADTICPTPPPAS